MNVFVIVESCSEWSYSGNVEIGSEETVTQVPVAVRVLREDAEQYLRDHDGDMSVVEVPFA